MQQPRQEENQDHGQRQHEQNPLQPALSVCLGVRVQCFLNCAQVELQDRQQFLFLHTSICMELKSFMVHTAETAETSSGAIVKVKQASIDHCTPTR